MWQIREITYKCKQTFSRSSPQTQIYLSHLQEEVHEKKTLYTSMKGEATWKELSGVINTINYLYGKQICNSIKLYITKVNEFSALCVTKHSQPKVQ